LRIDHPDGLWDPKDYLTRLKSAAPGAWIVVEKIIEPGEELPIDWPVDGTTGYEFLARVGELFVDPAGEKPLTEFYRAFTGEPVDCHALVREKKRWILRHQLATEVDRLVVLLTDIGQGRASNEIADPEALRAALVELVTCLPVYRTYARAGKDPLSVTDRAWLSQAFAQAASAQPPPSTAVLSFLSDLLHLKFPGRLEDEFVMRFQQLTGPAMAKGVEDTTFYCFNRLVALNEVGGDPARFGRDVEEFHQCSRRALEHWPNSMLASSTHDTKRSEEVRARLALLSEIPEVWSEAVRRWSTRNEKYRRDGLPDRNAEYLFYQTVVGAWPLPADRALAYMEKASREAKQHTNWTDRNTPYDEALQFFVTAVLGDVEFVADLERFLDPLVGLGQINSLAQTLLKLTAPGVPDIYQGTELWDLSLVDPDNRRPVDYPTRGRLQAELKDLSIDTLWQRRMEGLPKLWLIQKTLQFRREHPELFGAASAYEPLAVRGGREGHAIAFARVHGARRLLTIVPRFPLSLGMRVDDVSVLVGEWQDTRVDLPAEWKPATCQNILTGERIAPTAAGADTSLRLNEVLARFPVALLEMEVT
jgi:(1->4)-alpha-D-glucan 1-alpha-D-glucosylmutase